MTQDEGAPVVQLERRRRPVRRTASRSRRTDSFTKLLDSVKTTNTSWAPDLQKPAYRKSGPLYWRVASVDSDNNVGAYTSKRISAGKPMSVKLFGTVRRSATSTVRVRVRNGAGKALSGAKVRVAGAGARAQTKTTSRSGTVTLRVRPTRAGKVTFTVTKSGYAEKAPTLAVR